MPDCEVPGCLRDAEPQVLGDDVHMLCDPHAIERLEALRDEAAWASIVIGFERDSLLEAARYHLDHFPDDDSPGRAHLRAVVERLEGTRS